MLFTALILALAPSGAEAAITAKDGKARMLEFRDAVEVNIRPECRDQLAPIVAAIRYAENGGKGREFGILHPRCPDTFRGQAGWCSATVQKNWDRWVAAGSKGDFIDFLGNRYCPVGAENDPENLNRHWKGNVRFYTEKFNAN
jgi:hypothetical protein